MKQAAIQICVGTRAGCSLQQRRTRTAINEAVDGSLGLSVIKPDARQAQPALPPTCAVEASSSLTKRPECLIFAAAGSRRPRELLRVRSQASSRPMDPSRRAINKH